MRASLEARLNTLLSDRCLIYETEVASIHKEPPLVQSFHLLRALVAAIVIATVCVGTFVALDGQRVYIEVGYVVATVASGVSAGLSFVGMLRGFSIASAKFERLGGASANQATRPRSLRW